MKLKGNINHSVCRWCYNHLSLEALVNAAQEIGIASVELLGASEWSTVTKAGLTCAMANGTALPLETGFNDMKWHDQLLREYSISIPKAADAGLKNIICFSGNRNGTDDISGLDNCARGLEPVLKIAQHYNITMCIELLNSRVDHPDYQCDHTEWGVELCEKAGSPNLKLVYDIYHMQIMEGDVVSRIKKYSQYIAHYHTGGVPGRHEIDETQEIYYPAIMRAIVATGYKGFVAQEFLAVNDPIASLRDGVMRCDV
ncbi:MAG: TIM barrel protein [Chryseolinea sp.]